AEKHNITDLNKSKHSQDAYDALLGGRLDRRDDGLDDYDDDDDGRLLDRRDDGLLLRLDRDLAALDLAFDEDCLVSS
ncbi:unnamed protein product, partial [Rotaria socialis]